MANAIMVIKPYRWEGMWVFDDDRVGLRREPFVGGADTIIDRAVAAAGLAGADRGFVLRFSGGPFPGAKLRLDWLRAEMGGNVYHCDGQDGWLCPALLKYFDEPPATIYAQALLV